MRKNKQKQEREKGRSDIEKELNVLTFSQSSRHLLTCETFITSRRTVSLVRGIHYGNLLMKLCPGNNPTVFVYTYAKSATVGYFTCVLSAIQIMNLDFC